MKTAAILAAGVSGAAALNNGRALTPPMGWRSWNLYGGNVDQALIMSQMDGMVNRSNSVNGVPTSLSDLGFKDVGLDDNWQSCGSYGPNKYTFHDANGIPQVNTKSFPNFNTMTAYAHKLGLTAGWYGNNCICSDHCTEDACYEGDVNAWLAYGFDSIKLDGCGKELDLAKYAGLFNATGRDVLLENCHWGNTIPPNVTDAGCPYSYYRTSGDIEASYDSVVGNLQTVFAHAEAGVSAPNCWAYPDMLEVGCQHGPHGNGDPGLSFVEARTHFNAWCIVSSPLILSHDTNNATVTAQIWPIISNTEAIAVNQAWAGFSGSVFKAASVAVKMRASSAPAWQFLYKPVSASSTAVLLMNHAGAAATLTLTFSDIPKLPAPGANGYLLRDLNAHKDLGTFSGSYTATNVASHDSVFLSITPA